MPNGVFSVQEAIQLGEFVLAAYDLFAQGDPPQFQPPQNYQLVSKIYADDLTDNLPDFKVFGFIAQAGTDVVVAIRGTEGFLEWLMDFDFVPIPFPFVDAGRTENGFTNFYSSMRTGPNILSARVIDVLRSMIRTGSVKTLRIAGHSLDAALATLLAIDVALAHCQSKRCCADGAPIQADYVHVDAEVPINSDDQSKHNIGCWHDLLTYLHTLDQSVALGVGCVPA
jgi:hypothetical protein